jgi:AraC-like DNA-binding protein
VLAVSTTHAAVGYHEYAVAGPLRDHLVCVWQTVVPEHSEEPYVARILPDACVDLVMVGDGPVLIAGPATVPVTAEFAPGTTIVGARFRPGRAASWLQTAACELLNQHVGLFDVWGYSAHALWDELGTTPPTHRLLRLVDYLTRRLPATSPIDPLVAAAVPLLARADHAAVATTARELWISERQLHRRFLRHVGYGPKTLHRILRLQRLLVIADAQGSATYADLAMAAGYADVPHMARDIRELTGLSATELLRQDPSTLVLSDLFNGPDVSPVVSDLCSPKNSFA